MRISSTSGALALFVSNAAAFPAMSEEVFRRAAAAPQGAGFLPVIPPPFDAESQHVSTTGTHEFVAPSSSDARGMCPGLNAAANHGYLPHSGVATIQEFISGTYQVFGMAQDLSTFLAIYGSIVDGTGTGWSIGGVPHTGILGSHGVGAIRPSTLLSNITNAACIQNYDSDSSPIKSDLNQY